MVDAGCIAKTAKAGEEEVLVMANRTTHGGAEAMLVVGRRRVSTAVKSGSVEVSIAEELEDRSMVAVGAALGDDADYGGGVTTDLGAVVVCHHVELADCVRVGNLVAAVAQACHVETAIQVVRHLADEAVRRTVHQDLEFLVAEIVDRVVDLLDARHKLQEA